MDSTDEMLLASWVASEWQIAGSIPRWPGFSRRMNDCPSANLGTVTDRHAPDLKLSSQTEWAVIGMRLARSLLI